MTIMSSLRISLSLSRSRVLWLLAIGLIVATTLCQMIVATRLGRLQPQLQGREESLSTLDLDWRSTNADAAAENKDDAAADGTDMERRVAQSSESPSAYMDVPILKPNITRMTLRRHHDTMSSPRQTTTNGNDNTTSPRPPATRSNLTMTKSVDFSQNVMLAKNHGLSIEQLKVPTPIFVLSLPKSGTTTTFKYFECGLGGRKENRHIVSHHWMKLNSNSTSGRKSMRAGVCMGKNVEAARPILDGCDDNYQILTDAGAMLDGIEESTIITTHGNNNATNQQQTMKKHKQTKKKH
jgi:hypothetical protein